MAADGPEDELPPEIEMEPEEISSGIDLHADGTAKPRRVYGPDVGKVLTEVEGPNPSYAMTGKELYVRARVVSSKPHLNPYEKGDVETAWTQPVPTSAVSDRMTIPSMFTVRVG